MNDITDPNWRQRGSCNTESPNNWLPVEAWWPTNGRITSDNIAAAIDCKQCPVLERCRRFVDNTDPVHGVAAAEIRVADRQANRLPMVAVGVTASPSNHITCITCRRRFGRRWFAVDPAGHRSSSCCECEVEHGE